MSTQAKRKLKRRLRIKRSIRSKVSGNASSPRLTVFRSNKEIYAQLIDDVSQKTLAAASSLEKSAKEGASNKIEVATNVGKLLADKAKEAKIEVAVFDRNGFLYHGRIKALAEGARANGLKF